jgi:pteridine reductase
MDPRGRVALVTGAGRRVGRAIAIALGAQGMRVAVHFNGSDEGARETAALIQKGGSEAHPLPGDLRDPSVPASLVRATIDRFGSLDVLVNSAAVMERTPFGDVTAEQWDAMFALNLRAPFLLSQAAAPELARREGSIVNIADLAAFESWPAYIPHGITKAGVVQMTRSLAQVLAPRVRVNAVAPGAVLLPDDWDEASRDRIIETTPLRRLGSPDDVARAVVYLIEADYVTGDTLLIDGGRHVRR